MERRLLPLRNNFRSLAFMEIIFRRKCVVKVHENPYDSDLWEALFYTVLLYRYSANRGMGKGRERHWQRLRPIVRGRLIHSTVEIAGFTDFRGRRGRWTKHGVQEIGKQSPERDDWIKEEFREWRILAAHASPQVFRWPTPTNILSF